MNRRERAAYLEKIERYVNEVGRAVRTIEVARRFFPALASAYYRDVRRWLLRLVDAGKIQTTQIVTDKGLVACYYANDATAPERGKTVKERVLDALEDDFESSIVDVQRRLGTSFSTVSSALKKLFDEGAINRQKAGTGKRSRRVVYFKPFF